MFPIPLNKRFFLYLASVDDFLFQKLFLRRDVECLIFCMKLHQYWLWYCSIILNQMEIFCAPAEMRGRRVSKITKLQHKRILDEILLNNV